MRLNCFTWLRLMIYCRCTRRNCSSSNKNFGADYKSGYTLLFLRDVFPSVNMTLFSFTGGKLFEAGSKTWVTTEAGFSFVNSEKMSFTKQAVVTDGYFYTSSNYTVKKEKKTTIGGMLKADLTGLFYLGWDWVQEPLQILILFNHPLGFSLRCLLAG